MRVRETATGNGRIRPLRQSIHILIHRKTNFLGSGGAFLERNYSDQKS